MKKVIFSFLLILLLFANVSIACACTAFSVTEDGIVMVGNNEDGLYKDGDKDAKVWFLPAENRKFGRMFFGFKPAGPECGMNEKGLFFDWIASLESKAAPESPEKINYPGSLGEKILEECSTVSQALEIYEKYNEPVFGYATIMLADSMGESALVTWDWEKNELSVTKKQGDFQTIGHGYQIVHDELANNSTISAERARKLLDLAHQEDLTIYSNVFDLNKKEVTVYYLHNYDDSVQFNLEDELRKGKHLYNLYDLFPQQKYKMPLQDYFFKVFSRGEINLLFLLTLVFIAPFIALPAYWLSGRYSKKNRTKRADGKSSRMSWTVILLNSILGLLLLYLITRYAPFLAKYGYELMGKSFANLPVYMIFMTVAQILVLVFAWKQKLWNVILRVVLSITTIYAVYFIVLLQSWNLLTV